MDGAVENHHGTAIALAGKAALIRGPSGSGKSDLALRCLAIAPTALIPSPVSLVADDRVDISRDGDALKIAAPATIRGKLEVRGQGIIEVSAVASALLVLVADLVTPDKIERFPDPQPCTQIMGVSLPVIQLAPFEASAPVKLLLALRKSFMIT